MDKKVFGLDITESEYRDIKLPSYSLLSDMIENGTSVIGGKRNETIGELEAVIFGKIVDSILTDKKIPDNLVIIDKNPTGKAREIIKAITYHLSGMPNKDDFYHPDNEEIIDAVCAFFKFFKNKEVRMTRLKNYRDFQEKYSKVVKYLNSKGDIDNLKNYIFCSSYILSGAKKMSEFLSNKHPYYFKETPGVDVHYQIKLTEEVFKVNTKCMLDGCVIDHNKKEIIPFDLKTGSYDVDDFEEKGLIGWNYYIQAALYRFAIIKYIRREHPELAGYKLKSFIFIYSNRFHHGTDVIYDTGDVYNFTGIATVGFDLVTTNGKKYKITNLKSLLEIYQKHVDDN